MVVCFKCKGQPGVVCSRDGASKPYCSGCFLEFCTRLMRDCLFRHCGVPCGEPLAVAVSGGHSSMALLHQLGVLRAQNRTRPGGGRVDFEFLPLHLREDELVIPPQRCDAQQQQAELQRVVATMTEQFDRLEAMIRTQCTQWEFASAPLFTEEEVCVVRYSDYLSEAELQSFHALLHHPRLSLSDRELLHTRLRQRVLSVAAADRINAWKQERRRSGGWHHLLVGENALRCCTTAFREVMSGAGANVVHHGGFRGFVNQCLVLRPLRTLLPRELVQYCHLQEIWGGYTPALCTCTSLRSINRTLEAFFNNMMRSYRTSVFNVLNTIAKLDVETASEPTDVDLQLGATAQQAKRVIPGKTAQHHYKHLQATSPPRYSWRLKDETCPAAQSAGESPKQLCLLCGCLIAVAEEQIVTLQAQQRFLCDACLRFCEGLPEELASVAAMPASPGGLSSTDSDVGQRVATLTENGSFNAFSSLAMRMELLLEDADALWRVGDEGMGVVETRHVRRRLSAEDEKAFILQDDDKEEGDVDGAEEGIGFNATAAVVAHK
ncbi:cytoplasmic tRNA 2-thiolation protein 2 [Trypanosoma grayi]|uniref:cytoplasmic tRNA 2-thiolation protein 2 n=1 Tax=Trypanosoma grayi TaxID=71804 RepID=UPI0004F462C6|nr:cytoplasmic tRNA 2-thiolation protein 2 [Trypanosoma grayi]KEG10359.1 cytoplasmic tRNA 2-thiolation protein 2 [Trypanosoma grayi]